MLVWAAEGNERLGPNAVQAIEDAAGSGGLHVSAITFWEVSMLAEKGRLRFAQGVRRWIEALLGGRAVRPVPVDTSIAVDAGSLPGALHGDPADRLIVATARALACPLLTADEMILAYAREGHVEARDARL